jgi:ubiquinone/menaquinone biosynthesis C-methylase UbiE
MSEMSAISRFFVNLSAARRAARNYRWIQDETRPVRGEQWLEIGCGNGSLAERVVRGLAPGRYVATDIDPHQVEAALRTLTARFPEGWPPSLFLDPADMLRLPFDAASFDRVLAFSTIHHAGSDHHDFGAVPLALGEIDRVLRPAGRLIYEEFLHKEAIRHWLAEHGYTIERQRRRFRLELADARKPGGPSATPGPDAAGSGPGRDERSNAGTSR